MIAKIKKWIFGHPYFTTTVVFLIIMYFGFQVLNWQEENFAFILLLYLLVTLGIRLDDISRKIGTRAAKVPQNPADKASIMTQLNDIQHALLRINATLSRILEKTEKDDP